MEQGTIVVADDEANIAALVDLYLSREGYRVV
jgi:DNA-binding response OmpR family regulator